MWIVVSSILVGFAGTDLVDRLTEDIANTRRWKGCSENVQRVRLARTTIPFDRGAAEPRVEVKPISRTPVMNSRPSDVCASDMARTRERESIAFEA
jgi:hypothetical protein